MKHLSVLESLPGADIVRTAAAPTRGDIGKLGAIAVVPGLPGFFLDRDIAEPRTWSQRRKGKLHAFGRSRRLRQTGSL